MLSGFQSCWVSMVPVLDVPHPERRPKPALFLLVHLELERPWNIDIKSEHQVSGDWSPSLALFSWQCDSGEVAEVPHLALLTWKGRYMEQTAHTGENRRTEPTNVCSGTNVIIQRAGQARRVVREEIGSLFPLWVRETQTNSRESWPGEMLEVRNKGFSSELWYRKKKKQPNPNKNKKRKKK
jgi:hypothetical protein